MKVFFFCCSINMRQLTRYEMNKDKVKWNVVDDDEIN